MLQPQNCTISLNGSTTFKAWEENYINLWGHATNVKLWIHKNTNFIDLHQDIAHPHNTMYPLIFWDHTMSLHKVTHMLKLQYATSQVPHDHPNQRQKDNNSSKPFISDSMLKFGFPRILHSDNGTEFKSELIENLSQQPGIIKTFISLTTPKKMENWNCHTD